MGDILSPENFVDGQTVTGGRLNNAINGSIIQPSYFTRLNTGSPATTDLLAYLSAGTIIKSVTAGALESSLFGFYYSQTLQGDANYQMLQTDKAVCTSAVLTTQRTWTLPPANGFGQGQYILVLDQKNGVTPVNSILIAPNGTDTITNPVVGANAILNRTGGSTLLITDGNSKWTVVYTTPSIEVFNASISSVTGYASDTYLANSSVVIPAGEWTAGSMYHCVFDMTKTAAGVAAGVISLRIGTAGTTADTAVVTLTLPAGGANVDTATIDVWANFRAIGVGNTTVVQAVTRVCHGAVSGITSASANVFVTGTSAAFTSTTLTTLGLSYNGGASFAGTNTFVQTEYDQP